MRILVYCLDLAIQAEQLRKSMKTWFAIAASLALILLFVFIVLEGFKAMFQ